MEQQALMFGVNNAIKLSPKVAVRVLAAALAAGTLADLLLRATPWGLNAALLVLGFLAAGYWVSHANGVTLEGEGRWLCLPVMFFALALAWRDSPTLNVANALAHRMRHTERRCNLLS